MTGDVKVAVCLSVQEIVMSLARDHVMLVVPVLLIKSTTVRSVIIHVVKLVKENVMVVEEVVLRLAKAAVQVHVMILVCSIVQVIALLHVLDHVYIHALILARLLVLALVISDVFILAFIEQNLNLILRFSIMRLDILII